MRAAATLFAPAASAKGLLLAVSGGPDSVALMLLAASWQSGGATPPMAVATVDHNLRDGSAAEAQAVAGWAAKLGLKHHSLTYEGPKPVSRIQERARELRYDLLAQCATRTGADTIITAHHADDQAETILFRLTRGSGVAGLAGIAAKVDCRGLTLFRPLLHLPKADLVAVCQSQGQDFFTDPSNTDPRFARTGLRALAQILEREGLGRDALLRLGARAARADQALQHMAAAGAARLDWQRGGAIAQVDLRPLLQEPEEIALRILADALEQHGKGKPMRLDRLESLTLSLLAALREDRPLRGTLAGLLVRLDAMGILTLTPEGARQRGQTSAPPPG